MSSSVPSFDTAADVVSDVALELGIVTSAIEDPWAETDQNIIQLVALLKPVGRGILREREWSHLTNEYSLETVAGQAIYYLPNDFRTMIAQTGWDRTNRLPLGGPLSPQEWQYLKGSGALTNLYLLFRPLQGIFQLSSGASTPAAHTIYFEYMSNCWVFADVRTASIPIVPEAVVADQDGATAAANVICFDPYLFTRALKLRWLTAKGFDTTAAMADYEAALESAKSDDATAPVLSLSRSFGQEPIIGPSNVPFTGFGP